MHIIEEDIHVGITMQILCLNKFPSNIYEVLENLKGVSDSLTDFDTPHPKRKKVLTALVLVACLSRNFLHFLYPFAFSSYFAHMCPVCVLGKYPLNMPQVDRSCFSCSLFFHSVHLRFQHCIFDCAVSFFLHIVAEYLVLLCETNNKE